MKKIIIAILLMTLFTSCKKTTTEPVVTQFTEFSGTNWVLKNVHFKDGTVKSINEIIGVEEDRFIQNYYLHFTTDTYLRGTDGCNSTKCDYKIDGNNIQLDFYGGRTKIGCAFQDEVISILSYSTTYTANENTLIFHSDFEEFSGLEYVRDKTYEFQKKNLINKKWKLYDVAAIGGYELPFDFWYEDEETRSYQFVYQIEFFDDGTYKGISNCNSFDGKYELNNNMIKLIPGSVTEMACVNSTEYLSVFNTATYIYVAGNNLIIYPEYEGYLALQYHVPNAE